MSLCVGMYGSSVNCTDALRKEVGIRRLNGDKLVTND